MPLLMVFNKDGNVFCGQRLDNKAEAWQLPQGGIDKGELPIEAGYRELKEETQIDSTDIKYEFFEKQIDICDFDFYLGYCPKEYECKLDHENDDWGWFNMETLPKPLFPTLYSSLVRIF